MWEGACGHGGRGTACAYRVGVGGCEVPRLPGMPASHCPPPDGCISPTGYREGFLWKRGRDNGQFLSRKFVLTEREGALKYFNRNDVSRCQAGQRGLHVASGGVPSQLALPGQMATLQASSGHSWKWMVQLCRMCPGVGHTIALVRARLWGQTTNRGHGQTTDSLWGDTDPCGDTDPQGWAAMRTLPSGTHGGHSYGSWVGLTFQVLPLSRLIPVGAPSPALGSGCSPTPAHSTSAYPGTG